METTAQNHKEGHRYYIIKIGLRSTLLRVKLKEVELFLEVLGDCIEGAGDTPNEAIIDASIRCSKYN